MSCHCCAEASVFGVLLVVIVLVAVACVIAVVVTPFLGLSRSCCFSVLVVVANEVWILKWISTPVPIMASVILRDGALLLPCQTSLSS